LLRLVVVLGCEGLGKLALRQIFAHEKSIDIGTTPWNCGTAAKNLRDREYCDKGVGNEYLAEFR
jgi:hypothetical protein